MKKTVLALSAITLLPSSVSYADEPPVLLPVQRLHMDMAVKAAHAAIDACRKQGINIAVTIIDRGGHEQVVLRDTLAMPITVPVSKQKAYAAMNFNTPTSGLQGRFTSPFAPPKIDGLITSAGGLPITAGGSIVGGIGVSGAPSGKTDEGCAQAGLDAIETDLEMAM